MIYTHSHVDHFGGVLGVTSQADVDAGQVAVLAPEGFTAHAVQENVYVVRRYDEPPICTAACWNADPRDRSVADSAKPHPTAK